MKSERARYTGFEFEAEGFPALAIINTDLKAVDKTQYPYSVFIQIIPDVYDGNGHPTQQEEEYLTDIEMKIIAYLEVQTQTVHVGHISAYRSREIIFYTDSDGVVNTFLDHFLTSIERESSYDIEEDTEWNNVSDFYELI